MSFPSSSRLFHVLIVDHSLVSCRLVQQVICDTIEHKVEVTPCRTGQAALTQLQQQQFDLITTALMLPDMDGLDLCRTVRKDERHRYKPLVVISGDADQRLLREGFAAGVTDYFDKANGYRAFRHFITEFARHNGALSGHILYVEDSRTAALIATRTFAKHGLQVTHLPSAEAAYQLLQQERDSDNLQIDIVVTDFNLEGSMTGGDLLHVIRTRMHYSRQELPVLVITGNNDNETQIEIFHAGANDFVTKPLLEEIFIARIRSLLMIKQQYRALKQQANELRLLSVTDKLTGLYNRRYLTEHSDTLREQYQPLWVVMCDIDHFKKINDTYGHAAGDKVIAGVARVLLQSIDACTAIRYGGEEFTLLFSCRQPADAGRCLESIRQQVEQLNPADISVTISIGTVCGTLYQSSSMDALLDLADSALYAAKSSGRNCVYQIDTAGEPIPFKAS
ncbi:response regulator [Ectothiorhodospiraceae bacterium BW-2]|nr:response regulator [Ectothiorhodospiraceae bacterium BW-2]